MLKLENEARIREALHEAATFFGLGEIIAVKRLAGHANANFYVETQSHKYVLKFVFEHPVEDIRQEAVFRERLFEAHFPATMFIASQNGDFIFKKDGLNVVAMPWIVGDVPTNSPAFCAVLGEHLARLHMIDTSGLVDRNQWLRGDYLSRRFAELQKDYPKDTERFAAAIAHVQEYDFASLPKVFAHGDIHVGNCLTNKGKLAAILDWEDAGLVPAVLDLGMSIVNMCYPDDAFDAAYYRALMGAYEKVRPLADEERALLVGAVQLAGLTLSIWAVLQYASHFPDEEKLAGAYYYWRLNLEDFRLPRACCKTSFRLR